MSETLRSRLDTNKSTRSEILNLQYCRMQELPEELAQMDWVKELTVSQNPLSSLKGLPPSLRVLRAERINLGAGVFDGSVLPDTLEVLSLRRSGVTDICALPHGLIEVNVSDNRLSDQKFLTPLTKLKKLTAAHCRFTTFVKSLNPGLEYLDATNNNFSVFPNMRGMDALQDFRISGNNFTEIRAEQLPKNATRIEAYSCPNLGYVGPLPPLCEHADFSFCRQLTEAPLMNDGLKTANFETTGISIIDRFPTSMTKCAMNNSGLLRRPTIPTGMVFECENCPCEKRDSRLNQSQSVGSYPKTNVHFNTRTGLTTGHATKTTWSHQSTGTTRYAGYSSRKFFDCSKTNEHYMNPAFTRNGISTSSRRRRKAVRAA